MSIVIEAKHLTKQYQQGSEKIFGIKDISLTIHKGEFLSIVGRSGSGKSTLLNMLGAIDSPTSGEVIIAQRSLYDMRDRELTRFRSRHIGIIFQNFNLIQELRVLENIRLPLDLAKLPHDTDYEKELIDILELENRLTFYPYQLSGGQQQRVAIARALITKPKIVLADEPTGNLDKRSGDAFLNHIQCIHKKYGQTYLIVTHNMEIAQRTERIITIQDGTILSDCLNQ